MALPLLVGLNAAARSALPIIQAGVSRGLSSRAINEAIKTATGRGLRRQTLLDIIRAEKNIETVGTLLQFVGLDKLPNINRLPRALTRIRRRYSFTVRIVGQVAATGEEIIQNINVALDSVRTRREIERIAETAIVDGSSGQSVINIATTLIRGVRAGIQGTLSEPVEI